MERACRRSASTRQLTQPVRRRIGCVSCRVEATIPSLASLPVLFYSEDMLVAAWIAFLFVMLFLLGSAVGSFLNVCIVRLPQGRSLIRPASCCGHCHKPIRSRDNIPLLSYWLLRGRCRDCGAPFSMRYFWIELLTGFLFVLIYHFAIARNIHHFEVWSWYENDYEGVLNRVFDAQLWLVFVFHALLVCFLIVAVMCDVGASSRALLRDAVGHFAGTSGLAAVSLAVARSAVEGRR